MKNIFVSTLEELEEMEIEYNLEDCGMSGINSHGHWYCDDEAEVNVYYKEVA